MAIVEQYREQIRRFENIEYAGLILSPLKVSDYALYRSARPAMELMLSSLPPAIARLNWCAALWALDLEAAKSGATTGFFATAMTLLAKCANVPSYLDSSTGYTRFPIKPIYAKQTGVLTAVTIEYQGNPEILNMQQLDNIRQLIAAQNGYKIPDENWNPELLRAVQYTESINTVNLKEDLDELIFSVAAALDRRASELWNWPILEFQGARRAITRRINHQIYTQASMSGFIKFKSGNPFPSWEFDRETLPGDFKDIDSIANKEAKELLHDMTSNNNTQKE